MKSISPSDVANFRAKSAHPTSDSPRTEATIFSVTIFITLFNADRLFFPQPSPARPGKAELSNLRFSAIEHRAFKGDCSYLAEAVHLLAASQHGENAFAERSRLRTR